jgi:RNA recognition motif-containing protein
MVNFIPQTFDEKSFEKFFSEFGPIASSKLIIDKYTGRHIGYGFVNFTSLESAKAAIAKYNGYAIDGKWLKVVFARQSSNGTKRANLSISGLPVFFEEAQVREMLKAYGPIIDCKVLMTPEGESRGIAEVMISSVPLANRIISELNNSIPQGASSRITITFAEEPPSPALRRGPYRGGAMMPGPHGMPMMGGALPPYGVPYMPPMPYPVQQSYGPVRHDRSVDRVNPMAVPPAIRPVLHHPQDPYAPGENPAQHGYCLFTYNLPSEYDENMLTALYAPYGNATEVKMMRDPQTLQSRGFGFVNLPTLEQAVAAVNGLNGTSIQGRILKVNFKKPRGSNVVPTVPSLYSTPAGYGGFLYGQPCAVAPVAALPAGATAEDYGAAYQRALQQYQLIQASGGESQAAYSQAMQAYQAYQQVYQQEQQQQQQGAVVKPAATSYAAR